MSTRGQRGKLGLKKSMVNSSAVLSSGNKTRPTTAATKKARLQEQENLPVIPANQNAPSPSEDNTQLPMQTWGTALPSFGAPPAEDTAPGYATPLRYRPGSQADRMGELPGGTTQTPSQRNKHIIYTLKV